MVSEVSISGVQSFAPKGLRHQPRGPQRRTHGRRAALVPDGRARVAALLLIVIIAVLSIVTIAVNRTAINRLAIL